MIKVENIDAWGFDHDIRGTRNSMNSEEKSDSTMVYKSSNNWDIDIVPYDVERMTRLCFASPECRYYMRQIMISMDITAPLYWWKEFNTCNLGITADFCGMMHKIADKMFILDDFSHDHLTDSNKELLSHIIDNLNKDRELYLHDGGRKENWWQLIQMLPSSYNQKSTVTMNYENAVNIISQKSTHYLNEWRDFCNILLKQLPFLDKSIEVVGIYD